MYQTNDPSDLFVRLRCDPLSSEVVREDIPPIR